MSAHTPGPWDPAANWPHGMSMVCHHDGSGWRPVADCAVSGDAAEANARLIAAAPELLEALQLVADLSSQEWQESDGSRKGAVDNQGNRLHFISESVMGAARAAIAKATGSTA